MSRLPPLEIATTLGQGRPNYFRSMSAEAASGTPTSPANKDSPGSGIKTEVETPQNRPVSVYPLVSGPQSPPPPMPMPVPPRMDTQEEEQRGRKPPKRPEGMEYFGARREQSPQPLDREPYSVRTHSPRQDIQPQRSIDSIRSRAHGARRPNDLSGFNTYDSRALAPPRSPFAQRSPSPRSMSMDSSDDDFSVLKSSQTLSPPRKFSSGSGLSTSPTSPTIQHHMPRSPSVNSEMSSGGSRLSRPAFNFSRPLSRASATGVPAPAPADIPSRQASSDSQPSFILADDTAHTPVSMHSEGFPDTANENGAAPSYVYSRFSLPRGKMLQRNSLIFQENLPQAQYSWEQPGGISNVNTFHGNAPPSPPSRPSTSSRLDPGRPSLDPGRPSLDPGRPSTERGMAYTYGDHSKEQAPSIASSSTINAKSMHTISEMSAEEHVSKAIEFHEAGALTKSTYHLRLAARQNHPTGMLLYALACRHGWGCRPNQKEGVAWLRKAADSASLEIADDEDLIKEGKSVDILERKTRKAQFALSIYELGVSHMNGWGIEQDKVLALRCFEIAGSWGDADALAEAGFCYAQGIGCKKNLKKSAGFYRQAEAKGISMIGNSWIYKAKYNDGSEEKTSSEAPRSRSSLEKDKSSKKRDKSRTRGVFGRMKSSS